LVQGHSAVGGFAGAAAAAGCGRRRRGGSARTPAGTQTPVPDARTQGGWVGGAEMYKKGRDASSRYQFSNRQLNKPQPTMYKLVSSHCSRFT
jgi:hypothetical protein